MLPGPGPLVFETIPGTSRKEKERTELTVAFFPAVWERIEQDVLSNPGMLSEIDKRSWPPSYKNHPLVKKAYEEGRPWPLNLGLFSGWDKLHAPNRWSRSVCGGSMVDQHGHWHTVLLWWLEDRRNVQVWMQGVVLCLGGAALSQACVEDNRLGGSPSEDLAR